MKKSRSLFPGFGVVSVILSVAVVSMGLVLLVPNRSTQNDISVTARPCTSAQLGIRIKIPTSWTCEEGKSEVIIKSGTDEQLKISDANRRPYCGTAGNFVTPDTGLECTSNNVLLTSNNITVYAAQVGDEIKEVIAYPPYTPNPGRQNTWILFRLPDNERADSAYSQFVKDIIDSVEML